MPTATGTFQFPSVIPGVFCFFFFNFLRRLKKEEVIKMKATPLIVIFKKWHVCARVCVCVCVCVFYV